MRQNGILGFSIPHLVPEIYRFLKYANEKRVSNIYNMSGHVVSDIQTRAESEWLYI